MIYQIPSDLRFILTLITRQFFVMSVDVQVQMPFIQSREFTFVTLHHSSIHLIMNIPQVTSQQSWSLHCSTTNIALVVFETEMFGESILAV